MNKTLQTISKCVLLAIGGVFSVGSLSAQEVSSVYALGTTSDLANTLTVTGEDEYKALITNKLTIGEQLSITRTLSLNGSTLTALQPAAKVKSATSGHTIQFSVTPATDHTFKPSIVSFDLGRVGTDAANVDVKYSVGSSETTLASSVKPDRNNTTPGYTHFEYSFDKLLLNGDQPFTVTIYVYNVATDKEISVKDLRIDGAVDEPIIDFTEIVSGVLCSVGDLYESLKSISNGQTYTYPSRLTDGDPTDFVVTTVEGYSAETVYDYQSKIETITIFNAKGSKIMRFYVAFKVQYLTSATCSAGDLTDGLNQLNYGQTFTWTPRLTGDPTDFVIIPVSGYAALTTYNYTTKVANITILNSNAEKAMEINVAFFPEYIKSATCSVGDITSGLNALNNGEAYTHLNKLRDVPTDFAVEAIEGYTATVSYADKKAKYEIFHNDELIQTLYANFLVTSLQPHGTATPLNRGLIAISANTGNYVAWRARKTDPEGTRYYLYRGTTLVGGKPIINKSTNIQDFNGTSSSVYTLVVTDKDNNIIDKQQNVKTIVLVAVI